MSPVQGRTVVYTLIAAGALLAGCTAVYLAGARPITVDEIEYFRATIWTGDGLVPYRDFFEHHLPLQWYLFALPAKLVTSPGAAAIIAMRVLQLPLWALTFAALLSWMRAAGLAARERLLAIVALLASALFVMPAIEYRVDTVSTCAVIAALAVAERRRGALIAGALLSLAVLANIRFVVIAVIVWLLLLIVDVAAAAWRRPQFSRFVEATAGALIPALIYVGYLFATHSGQAFRDAIIFDNAAIDHFGRLYASTTLPMIIMVVLRSFDVGTILLLAGGVTASVMLDWGHPSRLHIAAIVSAVNLFFVLRMPVQYFYHFELTLLLCAVLLASVAVRAESLVIVVIAGAALITGFFTTRTSFDVLHVQDATMRAAQSVAASYEPVFDGSGLALRHPPAYSYWFLPLGVRFLAREKMIEPYTPAALARNPPAAVIVDPRMPQWLAEWPDLRRAIVQHYIPRWRNVWVPGGSGILGPGAEVSLDLVRDGAYRVIAGPQLLQHPWFHNPIACAMASGPQGAQMVIDAASIPNAPVDVVRSGKRIVLHSRATMPVGFFVFPASATRLFDVPDGGAPMVDPLFSLR